MGEKEIIVRTGSILSALFKVIEQVHGSGLGLNTCEGSGSEQYTVLLRVYGSISKFAL